MTLNRCEGVTRVAETPSSIHFVLILRKIAQSQHFVYWFITASLRRLRLAAWSLRIFSSDQYVRAIMNCINLYFLFQTQWTSPIQGRESALM